MNKNVSHETLVQGRPGWAQLVLAVLILLGSIACFILTGAIGGLSNASIGLLVAAGSVLFIVFILLCCGFYMLAPNQASVLSLFGSYRGTVRANGLLWANPFYSKKKISLRSRNLNGDKLKVNDQIGNPIEIAAVIVWKVNDTYKASYDVENYESYIKVQSESSVRHLANLYPYDLNEGENSISLRGNTEEVSAALKQELNERMEKAGIVIEEARISHLAYAPEIAAAMLQRQQATAVIAARQKIVEGAVGMVEMAIEKLGENGVVALDDERKAAMVSNLMVVLCGEKSASPIVNTGTLYQ